MFELVLFERVQKKRTYDLQEVATGETGAKLSDFGLAHCVKMIENKTGYLLNDIISNRCVGKLVRS